MPTSKIEATEAAGRAQHDEPRRSFDDRPFIGIIRDVDDVGGHARHQRRWSDVALRPPHQLAVFGHSHEAGNEQPPSHARPQTTAPHCVNQIAVDEAKITGLDDDGEALKVLERFLRVGIAGVA
jgi:hypothetical protein